GDRVAVGQVDRHRRSLLAVLEALIALDALLDLPFGLALVPEQLHAVDAALRLVDVAQRIDEAGPDRDAARRVRPDTERRKRDELLLGLVGRSGDRACEPAGCQ